MTHNDPGPRRGPELFGFGLGLFATWSQIVVLREALTLGGGSEIALALGLAGWLLGVGTGALLGALPRPRRSRLFAAALLAGPVVGAALLGLRLHRLLAGLAPGEDPALAGLAALTVAGAGLAGATAGFLFTLAARTAPCDSERPVTRLYLGEAAGALVAGVTHTFLLAGWAGALSVIGAGAAVLLAGCAIAAPPPWGRLPVALPALALLACAWPREPLPLAGLDAATTRRAFDLLGAGGRLLGSCESPYGRLALGERDGQYQLFADGRLDHAFPDPWDAPPPLHVALAAHPRPRRVLLLGGAVPDRLEAVLAHDPERVVLTFLDGAALELGRPFWPASTRAAAKDPRVALVVGDGRRYVEGTQEKFDVVIVSARPPLSAREMRFHTEEFFAAVRRILEPGGLVAMRAPGGATVLAPEAARGLAAARATVGRVFHHALLVPGIETWILAGNREIDADPEVLAARFANAVAPGFSARRFAQILDPSRIRALEEQLRGVPDRVATDREPAGYLANLELWERHSSGPGRTAEPTWIGGAGARWWLWLAAGPLGWAGWRLLCRRGARRRRSPGPADAVFAIGVTGAAGMGVTVVTLYAFQAAAGTVYTALGLLVGLFMAGLAAGAALGWRRLAPGPARAGPAAAGAMLGFLLASGPVLAAVLGQPWLIAAWATLGGAVTGAAFPALLSVAAGGGDERRFACAIESADHLGAAFGAFVVGVIWLPVHGLVVACLLLAALQAVALIGLLPPGRRPGRG
jgi:spermidine synthase